MLHKRVVLTLLLVLPIGLCLSGRTAAQAPRDYMTDDEIELVRDAQDIDDRVNVLTRMIDRRFAVLNVNVGGPGVTAKESSKWGPAPSGSRIELISDIRKLLEKAIDDVDNVAMHPAGRIVDNDNPEKEKKKDAQRFPGAVRNLAAAAGRYQSGLKSLLDGSKDEKEKGSIMAAMELCDEIITASAKVASRTSN